MTLEVGKPDSAPRRAVIFESYGWADAAEIAGLIKSSLEAAGYEVWIDRDHIRPDEPDFWEPLQKVLGTCNIVVALLSPHSRRLDGDISAAPLLSICHNELIMAVRMNKTVVPATVISCRPPLSIAHYDPIDLTDWSTSPEAFRAGIDEMLHWIREGLAEPQSRRRYSIYVDNLSGAKLSFPEELSARENFVGRQWLMDEIDTWLAGSGRCFLIEAEPGAGKTALVAELVRRNPGDRILAYHFCSSASAFSPTARPSDTADPGKFVRSLAAMLCGTLPAYRERLQTSPEIVSALKSDNDPKTMLWRGILEPLHALAPSEARYIVVDALDEAAGASDVSIPELLAQAIGHFPSWLRLLATTRRDDRVPSFQSAKRGVLAATQAEQRDDLRAYIERRLAEPALRGLFDDAVCRRIAAAIAERSAGNFQYVATVLDELSIGAIALDQIDRLPSGLAALYESRAKARFPAAADFEPARTVLSVLLAARQPPTRDQLALFTGLDRYRELRQTLDRLSCFVLWEDGLGGERFYRLAHKSISDWLIAPPGGSDRFRVDVAQGRTLIIAHCRNWATHREPYALMHLVPHLLDAGCREEALAALRKGFFATRREAMGNARQDLDDTRSLVLALAAEKDQDAILELAQTDNIWQRDGVAAALQALPGDDVGFIDRIVNALLRVTR